MYPSSQPGRRNSRASPGHPGMSYSTDAMNMIGKAEGGIVLDDQVDGRNIETSRGYIGSDEERR